MQTMEQMIKPDGDLDHRLDLWIVKGLFIVALISNIRGVGPWQRYAISECSCLKRLPGHVKW